MSTDAPSVFKTVFDSTPLNDGLYFFLQEVYRLYPEDQFHYVIAVATREKKTDEDIYKKILADLPAIKPFLSRLTWFLPALRKQKKELGRQTVELLGGRKVIEGYLEIGSGGKYVSEIKRHVKVKGNIFLMDDITGSNTFKDAFENGQLKKPAQSILPAHLPISSSNIDGESLDVVTCYTGLHHCPHDLLDNLMPSVHRVLRKGGLFIIREYDVRTQAMETLVSLILSIFNLVSNTSWEKEAKEFRSFRPIDDWSDFISSFGFEDSGKRLLQEKDASNNTLVAFTKL